MHDALVGYRGADAYPRQSRAMVQALDDAEDLKAPLAGMRTQVALLQALMTQVGTRTAEDAIEEAIGHIEDAVAALECGADKVVNDCDD